jgi:hypothetical protein
MNSDLSFTLEGIAPVVAAGVIAAALSAILIVTPIKRRFFTGGTALLSTALGTVFSWIMFSATTRHAGAAVVWVAPFCVGATVLARWGWLFTHKGA